MGKKKDRALARQELRERFQEVHLDYARAMEQAQELEHTLILISLAMGTATTVEALESDALDLARKPIERLRRELGSRFGGELGQLERDIDRVRRIRNFLAHNYFHERSFALVSMEGCEYMGDELLRASMFIGLVTERLMDKFEDRILSFGENLTEEESERIEALLEPEVDSFGAPIPGLPEPGTVPGML
ncbi:hypothetical protein MF672_007745 [Actinomadura sp. ATCC 31491]|uniref:DUF86 domain-containing protein n=1 Tax=Actinomadura luzonensis TaxID=2805427 RepID=A0ABT0FN18_9ACTN|nr:hypothetical protein [Actinomadura luzonensis]MCK2213681.1 hypothetical protein [Actinomadura luzonensis]